MTVIKDYYKTYKLNRLNGPLKDHYMPTYNLAANLLFEYSYFTFESYVVQSLCEIDLAVGIEVFHTF